MVQLISSPVRMINLGRAAPLSVDGTQERSDAFYHSQRWRQFADSIIKARGRKCESPRCRDPHKPSRRYVDHIRELKDGGARLDPANVQVLCRSCHLIKTHDVAVKRALRNYRANAEREIAARKRMRASA